MDASKKNWYLVILLFTLLSCSQQATLDSEIKIEKLLQTEKCWDGADLPAYPLEKPEISILKVSIPPHSKLGLHKHTIINAGVLITGELTVITEHNDTLHMKSGDALSEVVETWHYGINEGDKTAEIIVFYAGTSGIPLSVHASEDKQEEN